MGKILGIGEVMMRLSPQEGKRLVQAEDLRVFYGGSEANAISVCADCGDETEFFTALPANPLGQAALNALRWHGIGTDKILRPEGRLGVYYCDLGYGIRPTSVVYDRKDSAAALLDPEKVDYDALFEGVDWLHISGITSGISANGAKLNELACKKAKEKGIPVSCDLNYRGKLWSKEEAMKTMIPLMQYVDICITNEADSENCLGIHTSHETFQESMQEIQRTFGFDMVLSIDIDAPSTSENYWTGYLYDGNEFKKTETLHVMPILDRIGAGDACSGGFIHAIRKWNDPQKALEFAVYAGALKAVVSGDLSSLTENEVLAMMSSGKNAIQR